jgi:hypothetical protein
LGVLGIEQALDAMAITAPTAAIKWRSVKDERYSSGGYLFAWDVRRLYRGVYSGVNVEGFEEMR